MSPGGSTTLPARRLRRSELPQNQHHANRKGRLSKQILKDAIIYRLSSTVDHLQMRLLLQHHLSSCFMALLDIFFLFKLRLSTCSMKRSTAPQVLNKVHKYNLLASPTCGTSLMIKLPKVEIPRGVINAWSNKNTG